MKYTSHTLQENKRSPRNNHMHYVFGMSEGVQQRDMRNMLHTIVLACYKLTINTAGNGFAHGFIVHLRRGSSATATSWISAFLS